MAKTIDYRPVEDAPEKVDVNIFWEDEQGIATNVGQREGSSWYQRIDPESRHADLTVCDTPGGWLPINRYNLSPSERDSVKKSGIAIRLKSSPNENYFYRENFSPKPH